MKENKFINKIDNKYIIKIYTIICIQMLIFTHLNILK